MKAVKIPEGYVEMQYCMGRKVRSIYYKIVTQKTKNIEINMHELIVQFEDGDKITISPKFDLEDTKKQIKKAKLQNQKIKLWNTKKLITKRAKVVAKR